jgi:hypothetical protein
MLNSIHDSHPLFFQNYHHRIHYTVALFLYFIYRGSKEKSSYPSVTGRIISYTKRSGTPLNREFQKHRYLEIDAYPLPFDIFIGKDFGDFKPQFEQVDKLSIGDTITIYFYETQKDFKIGINRGIQFIDKKGQSYFERGSSKNAFAFGMIGFCAGMIGFCYWAYKKVSLVIDLLPMSNLCFSFPQALLHRTIVRIHPFFFYQLASDNLVV